MHLLRYVKGTCTTSITEMLTLVSLVGGTPLIKKARRTKAHLVLYSSFMLVLWLWGVGYKV